MNTKSKFNNKITLHRKRNKILNTTNFDRMESPEDETALFT